MESLLSFLPSSESRKSYRLQCSLSLEEAAELEKYLTNPALPFQGDISLLVRTLVRSGITQMHNELNAESESFIQSMKPLLGSELLRWSSANCDMFAVASTDHLSLAIESGDIQMGQDVFDQVANVVQEVKNKSARSMLKRSLLKRGFSQSASHLRELMLNEDHSVYLLDTKLAEVFS